MFLNTLIRASIQDGLLILALLIGLRLFAIPPKVRVWLWRAVYVKLAFSLLPFGSIPLKVLPQEQAFAQAAVDSIEMSDVNSSPAKQSPDPWLWAWSSGVLVAGIFTLIRYHKCREAVLRSNSTSNDEVASILLGLGGSAGKRKLPDVFVSSELSSAVVVGSRTPTILLPQELPHSEDLRLVLAHELAHVVHRDLEWNAFTSLVDCLFFFHPLAWMARRASQQAQEAAADAAAIRLTNASPKRYGEMLVRATILDPSPSFSAGLSVGAPTGRIRMRLEELRYVNARPTISKLVAAAALAGIVISMAPAYEFVAKDSQELTPVRVANTLGTALVAQSRPIQHRSKPKARSTRKATRTRPTIVRYWRGVKAPAPATTVIVTRAGSRVAPQAVQVVGEPAEVSTPSAIDVTGVEIADAPSTVTVGGMQVPATASRVTGVRTTARPARVQTGRVSVAMPAGVATTSVTVAPATATRISGVGVATGPVRASAGGVSVATPSAARAAAAPASTDSIAAAELVPSPASQGVTVTSEPIAAAEMVAPSTSVTIAQGVAAEPSDPFRVTTAQRGRAQASTTRVSAGATGARTYRVMKSSDPFQVTTVRAKGRSTGVGRSSGRGSARGSGTSHGRGSSAGRGVSTGRGSSGGGGASAGSGTSVGGGTATGSGSNSGN